MLIKQLSPDPFEHIENYELKKIYKAKVVKLMDFGAFCELEPDLQPYCIQVNLVDKKEIQQKCLKLDEIDCVMKLIKKKEE